MDSDFTGTMHMMIMFQKKFDKSQNLGTWCDLEDVVWQSGLIFQNTIIEQSIKEYLDKWTKCRLELRAPRGTLTKWTQISHAALELYASKMLFPGAGAAHSRTCRLNVNNVLPEN